MDLKNDSSKVIDLLSKEYPDAKVELDYSNPLELMVATMLSAQCTDKRVNMVTPGLFKKYKTINDYAKADIKIFEEEIRSTGFYHNKAKNIIAAANMIKKDFDGKIPMTMEGLLSLPGIARKTANIILTNGFDRVEGIAVDTHVMRLSQRLGLTKNNNPDKIERDLMGLFDKKDWKKINTLLVLHGRRVCDAKKPRCDICVLNRLCPSAFKFPKFKK